MPHIAMQEKPRATRAKPQATGSRDIPRSRAKTLKSGTRSKGTMVSRATMFRVSSSRATRSRVSRSRATHSRATHRQAIKHNPMVLLPPPLPSPPGCTPPPTPPHDYPHCHCRCHPLVSAKCARIAPLLGGSKLARPYPQPVAPPPVYSSIGGNLACAACVVQPSLHQGGQEAAWAAVR